MQIDIAFQNAKIYDIRDHVDVIAGVEFTLFTDADPGSIRWLAENDEALQVTTHDNQADVIAQVIGKASVIITTRELGIIRVLELNVLTAIPVPASKLGFIAGEPELK